VQPAQPPVAGFTANPPSATVGQPVQFTNTTTGDVTSFEWNFGDGAASNEANPQHVFNSPGDFTVSLRAIGPGGENTAQQTVSVADVEQPKQPGIVEELPILPDLEPQAVRNRLRAIFDNGAAQGRRAGVFSVIGDNMALQPGYLAPFADASLDTGSPDFDAVIDWYNQIDLGDGRTSFNRRSLAASSGWRVQDLLDPSRSDGASCNPGETPLECELRVSQAAVAIISIGMSDVGVTDPATFRATMEQVLQIVLSRGVIPVVTTIQPNPNNADQVAAINEALVEAIQNVEASSNTAIPIYNLWRAYTELPNNGLEGDGFTPTTAPNGPGVISSDVAGTYATNRRNRQTLNLLNRLHTQIFPDAAP
jgi:PKD repeat protein